MNYWCVPKVLHINGSYPIIVFPKSSELLMCPQGPPHQCNGVYPIIAFPKLSSLLMCPQGHPRQLGPILSWHFPMVLNAKAKNTSNLDLFTGASDDKLKSLSYFRNYPKWIKGASIWMQGRDNFCGQVSFTLTSITSTFNCKYILTTYYA